ncbi:hypothetical protein CL638_01280 [bacterium]|nr:hypothetical protein [bacterium]|tara:strand:+ start:413 stop:640 length:228 start_codon:yes stop_codon:yes gene_type:complete
MSDEVPPPSPEEIRTALRPHRGKCFSKPDIAHMIAVNRHDGREDEVPRDEEDAICQALKSQRLRDISSITRSTDY